VASAVGGLPEVVEDGKTGFLVTGGDFEKPVRRLLEDAALAAQMARAGRERVEREFSVEEMVEKTMRAYREVLG
jgi:starch synthase